MLAQHSVDPSVKKSLEHKHFQQEQDDLCGTSEYVRITAGQVFGEIVETEENLDFIMKMSSRLKPISVSSILTLTRVDVGTATRADAANHRPTSPSLKGSGECRIHSRRMAGRSTGMITSRSPESRKGPTKSSRTMRKSCLNPMHPVK